MYRAQRASYILFRKINVSYFFVMYIEALGQPATIFKATESGQNPPKISIFLYF